MAASSNQAPDGEESWTFVSSKRHRQSGKRKPRPLASHPDASVSQSQPAPTRVSAQLTVEEIERDYKKFSEQWNQSGSCRQLEGLASSRSAQTRVTKAICVGLGSFDPEDGSWQVKRRSHIQLAAFVTLVQSLEKLHDLKIRCLFQEPCFTDSDKRFLQSLGYEVVDSPAGFDEVSADCLVYGIHLYKGTYSTIIEKHIPAIFVGTGYETWENYADTQSTEWARMKELDESCGKARFPEESDFYPAFTSTSIHWRNCPENGVTDLADAIEGLSIKNPDS